MTIIYHNTYYDDWVLLGRKFDSKKFEKMLTLTY